MFNTLGLTVSSWFIGLLLAYGFWHQWQLGRGQLTSAAIEGKFIVHKWVWPVVLFVGPIIIALMGVQIRALTGIEIPGVQPVYHHLWWYYPIFIFHIACSILYEGLIIAMAIYNGSRYPAHHARLVKWFYRLAMPGTVPLGFILLHMPDFFPPVPV